MLSSAGLLVAVRDEVAKVACGGFVVTDGSHQDGAAGYPVVVRCGGDEEKVARRLRDKIPDVETSRIASGVLGIRYARRVRRNVS
jgi:hypothetical protein